MTLLFMKSIISPTHNNGYLEVYCTKNSWVYLKTYEPLFSFLCFCSFEKLEGDGAIK